MTRFHAGIPVPTPLDAVDAAETRGATAETSGQDGPGERGTDPRCVRAHARLCRQVLALVMVLSQAVF